MIRVLTKAVGFILFVALFSGCAVGMAMKGKKDPDLSVIQFDARRSEVEFQLGSPRREITLHDGRTGFVYTIKIGNKSSPGAAFSHAVADVVTIGIWELVGTPLEAMRGKKDELHIAYDQENRVCYINGAHREDYIKKRGKFIRAGTPAAQDDPPSIYDKFMESVVVVRIPGSLGTGFFITNTGLLLTNQHVVKDNRRVSIEMRDGSSLLAAVIAIDKKRDLALLSTKGDGFSFLKLGSIKDAPAGSEVIAIGAPIGLTWSFSKGIVSAFRAYNGVQHIQTDAAINNGNSGGPLISLDSGHVIGVNSSGIDNDIAEGLNFAVTAQEVRDAFVRHIKD